MNKQDLLNLYNLPLEEMISKAEQVTKEIQELGLKAGINGLLAGDYLTTKGVEAMEDMQMIKNAGKVLEKA